MSLPKKKRAKPIPRSKPVFDVRVLDHLKLCGINTSCRGMFMVQEKYKEHPTIVHQVFIDKHGMYCAYHGVDCYVIPEVEKANRKLKIYT